MIAEFGIRFTELIRAVACQPHVARFRLDHRQTIGGNNGPGSLRTRCCEQEE